MSLIDLPTPPGPLAAWLGLVALIPVALICELCWPEDENNLKASQLRGALLRTGLWVLAAGVFAFGLAWSGDTQGREAAEDFVACYLLELSLSADNLFVFLLLFERFGISERGSHRVLMWGLLGAVVMRAVFVTAGSGLILRFHRLIYVLGGFLLLTAIRLLMEHGEHRPHTQATSWPSRLWQRLVPQASQAAWRKKPDAFWVREDRMLKATPLLTVLVAVESADIIFAVDSVPAAFGITTNVWVVLAANLCAILGLRSLFFVLGGLLGKMRYLRVALAIILALVGLKMLVSGIVDVPTWATLGAIVLVLGTAIVASRLRPLPT